MKDRRTFWVRVEGFVGLWHRFRFWLFGGVYYLPDGSGANGQPPLWERWSAERNNPDNYEL